MLRRFKGLALLLAALLALMGATAQAEETPADYNRNVPQLLHEGHLYAQAAVLVDASNGDILFAKNARQRMYPASTTKVMTLLLALESGIAMDTTIVIPKQASEIPADSSLIPVFPGDVMKFRDLLYGFMLTSGNDGANAIAAIVSGNVEGFVDRMNRRAAELGMEGTHFENCTGLPAQGQHTTARDVAVMARQMFSHPEYFDYSAVWMEDIDHGDGRVTQLVNTNKLLKLYDGCDGGKTGSTNEAGYCVAATAKRSDMRLIAVVLGAASGKERFAIAGQMLDYGFANYRKYPVAARGTRVKGALPVTGGTADGVALMLDGDLTLLVNRGDEQRVSLSPELPEAVPAPVHAGDVVGHVTVNADGREIARIPVVAAEDVPKKGGTLQRIFERWVLTV